MAKLEDLQLVRIPICKPDEPQLTGYRSFDSSDEDVDELKNQKLPFVVIGSSNGSTVKKAPKSARSETPLRRSRRSKLTPAACQDGEKPLTQSVLPFGKFARVSTGFDFGTRSFAAFKFALSHLAPHKMRFAETGLELAGHAGCAFLSRDMFHNYPNKFVTATFFSTKFTLLSSFMNDRTSSEKQKFQVDLTDTSLELCGNLLTLPKTDVDVDVDVDVADGDNAQDFATAAAGKRLGPSVYTSSFQEFLSACAALSVKQAKLVYTCDRSEESLFMVAKVEDGSAITAPLEPCFDDESAKKERVRRKKTKEFEVNLTTFAILSNAKQTMFFPKAGGLDVRFCLGGDSFVQCTLT